MRPRAVQPAPAGCEQVAAQRARALIAHLEVQQSPTRRGLYRAMAAFYVLLALVEALAVVSSWPGTPLSWALCLGLLALAGAQWTRPASSRRQQRRLQHFLTRHAP